jgi:hypothetical protein
VAKHLTDNDINNIISLLDGWDINHKLTWDNLCSLALKIFKLSSTRQTIQKPVRIKEAFINKKKALKFGIVNSKTPPSLNIASKRIDKLESENKRLKQEQNNLLAQFVVWQYNAYAHGLTIDQLNRSIPEKR